MFRYGFLSLIAALMLAALSFSTRCFAGVPAHAANASTGAYVPLAPENAEVLVKTGGAELDAPATGRIPNYLRALAATYPNAAQPFAKLFRTVIYGGTVESEIKTAIGLEIAHAVGSDYLAAHMTRILKATERGRALLAEHYSAGSDDDRAHIALLYAEHLTRNVHGVDDGEFAHAHRL